MNIFKITTLSCNLVMVMPNKIETIFVYKDKNTDTEDHIQAPETNAVATEPAAAVHL